MEHRRGAVDDLHGAFAETIHRYPRMYDELRRAGVAAVLGDAANFDPVEQVERQKAFEAKAATAAIAGMAALNADGAEKELDDGRFDDVFDAGQKAQLRARIGLAREDRESELTGIRRDALADMDREAFAFLSGYRRKLADGAARGCARCSPCETAWNGTRRPARQRAKRDRPRQQDHRCWRQARSVQA